MATRTTSTAALLKRLTHAVKRRAGVQINILPVSDRYVVSVEPARLVLAIRLLLPALTGTETTMPVAG